MVLMNAAPSPTGDGWGAAHSLRCGAEHAGGVESLDLLLAEVQCLTGGEMKNLSLKGQQNYRA